MTEVQYKNKRLNIAKLKAFGFVKVSDEYIYKNDVYFAFKYRNNCLCSRSIYQCDICF